MALSNEAVAARKGLCSRKKCIIAIEAVLVACFFTLGIDIDKNTYGFWVFESIGKNGILISSSVIIGIFWCLQKAEKLLCYKSRILETGLQVLLSVFFTVFSLLSKYFEYDTDYGMGILTDSLSSKLSVCLAFVGGMVFFMHVFRLIWSACGSIKENEYDGECWLSRFFGNHLFRNCVVLVFLAWLPFYIIRFPGCMTYDAINSMGMYLGEIERTAIHPLIWGTFIGKIAEIGLNIGIDWFTPFVICTLEHVVLILLIAYTVQTLKEFGASLRVLAITLFCYIIQPNMFMWASTVNNDILYAAAIQLFTVELLVLLYSREVFFKQKHHCILMVIAVLGTILRYNGLYTMLVVILGVALHEGYLVIKRQTKAYWSAIVLILMIVPLIMGQWIQNGINMFYGVRPTSRAKYAMVIQQSARCLALYGDEISKEDYEALHTVLTWTDEELNKSYNPLSFDGVKNAFKADATKEELVAFLKAWLNLLKEYPGTCFRATANVVYHLFSPFVQNVCYFVKPYDSAIYRATGFDVGTLFSIEPLYGERVRYDLHYIISTIFSQIPLIGLVVNQAMYNILLIGMCGCTLFKKDRRLLVLSLALLVTLGITTIGPTVHNHPRYTYPIVYSMPVLVAAFIYRKDE